MNLKKLFEESGHKAVAQKILQEYSSTVSLRRPLKKRKIQLRVPEILYDYVKITKSTQGVCERLEEIILQEVRRTAEEQVKLY